jgi:hypothetical protein
MNNLPYKGLAQVTNGAHLAPIAGMLTGLAGAVASLPTDPQAVFYPVKHWLPPLTSQCSLELLYGSAGLIVGLWVTQLALFCFRNKTYKEQISSGAVAGSAFAGLVAAVGSWAAFSVMSAQGVLGNSVGDLTFVLPAALLASLSAIGMMMIDSSLSHGND